MKRLLEGVGPGARLVLLAVAVLGLGVVIGLVIGPHHKHPAPEAVQAVPTAQQVADAPHPVVGALPPDPPATETSRQTVLEDEPVGPPLPEKAPGQDKVSEAMPQLPVTPAPEVGEATPAVPPPPVASLPQSQPQPQSQSQSETPALPKGTPPWKRYALASPATNGKPMIAVIIDDMGVDKKRSEKILQLPGPLTISLMSYADDLGRLSEEARRQGDELMMHVPMEPMAESVDPGPGALLTSLSEDEIRKRFSDDLDRFSGYVGINNHMGSKFTAYAPGMTLVMEELRRRGLLFIDSLTTEHSVGLDMAHRFGIPTAGRNVFLDNAGDLISVDLQLSQTEQVARKKGNAIAIGHPRDATIQALEKWLPTLEAKGFVLVPVTTVVRARMGEKPAPTTTASASTHSHE